MIHEHGIISKINANNDGFDYLPTYASPDEKYPAICVYLEDIAFTNWGVSGANFEPLGNKIVIFFQSHYIKYFLFNFCFNFIDEECAKICSSPNCDNSWRAISCTETLPYICEKNLKCPQGWVSYEDSCYKLEQTKTESIAGSQAQCMLNYDSDIFVPNTKSEAKFISDFIGSKCKPEVYHQNSMADVMIGARQSNTKSYIEYSDGM